MITAVTTFVQGYGFLCSSPFLPSSILLLLLFSYFHLCVLFFDQLLFMINHAVIFST